MIKVMVSTVIDAPLPTVWNIVSNFNGLPNWHPAVGKSQIDDGKSNNEIGCVRNLFMADDSGVVRETLLAQSDVDHEITYNMIGGPLPFVDYVAVMHFQSLTDGDKTFARWTAEYGVSDGQEDHWREFVATDVFLGGFKALEEASRRA